MRGLESSAVTLHLGDRRRAHLGNWLICRHITEADLAFFQECVEEDVQLPGTGKWEHMTDLKLDSLTYSAWRRRLAVSCPSCLFVMSHSVKISWAQECLQHKSHRS